MKRTIYALTAFSALISAGSAVAESQTATIEVTGLYCSSCPYIAAQAVSDVPSAEIVDGFYDPGLEMAQFVVLYDDELTTLAEVIAATGEFGYPATLVLEN